MKMKRNKMIWRALWGLVAAAFLVLSGCHHVRMVTVNVPPAEVHRVWMHGFLWGFVGSEITSESVCGNRMVASVDTYLSLPNFLLLMFTGGLYTPRTMVIQCASTTIE